jgi:ribosome-associated toxin RatA of RatAB toxin-antitoxin module
MSRSALIAASLAFLSLVSRDGDAAKDDEADKLKAKGEAVEYVLKTTDPANAIDTGGAAVFINAPIEDVRKIVQDYGHYNQLVKTFEQSRVLEKKKGTAQVYLSIPVLHGALTIWAVSRFSPPEKDGTGEKITSKYERGNLADFRGTWRLRAVDETHTVLKLELLVDPKLPVPTSLITGELKSAAWKGVMAVREKAQSAATPIASIAVGNATTPKPGGDKPPSDGTR